MYEITVDSVTSWNDLGLATHLYNIMMSSVRCLWQVVTGSLAENSGLSAGDVIQQINGRSTDDLSHEEAKQEIVASGNRVNLAIQRWHSLTCYLIYHSNTTVYINSAQTRVMVNI